MLCPNVRWRLSKFFNSKKLLQFIDCSDFYLHLKYVLRFNVFLWYLKNRFFSYIFHFQRYIFIFSQVNKLFNINYL